MVSRFSWWNKNKKTVSSDFNWKDDKKKVQTKYILQIYLNTNVLNTWDPEVALLYMSTVI